MLHRVQAGTRRRSNENRVLGALERGGPLERVTTIVTASDDGNGIRNENGNVGESSRPAGSA